MANAQVAEELRVGSDAFGDLPEGEAIGGDNGFTFGIYMERNVVRFGEGGPL